MRIRAIIETGTSGVSAALAAESLRRAAELGGRNVAVELRGPEEAVTAFTEKPESGEVLLLIGKPAQYPANAALPYTQATLEEVLEDAADVLSKLNKLLEADRSDADEALPPLIPALESASSQDDAVEWNFEAPVLPVVPASPAVSGQTSVYTHLAAAMSFLLPFAAAGGLLVALAHVFGAFGMGGVLGESFGGLAQAFKFIGASGALALLVPVLSGYIAFSLAGRSGLAPGMIGGMVCMLAGTGFLGGMAAGFAAGYAVLLLGRIFRTNADSAGTWASVVLPLVCAALTGLVAYYALGKPAGALVGVFTAGLDAMRALDPVLLGLALGVMTALDLGGPASKAAFAFAALMFAQGVEAPLAAVTSAAMTAPLAAALSVWLFPCRYSREERRYGLAALVMGLAAVSEGAVPFALRDPLRVIPALALGAAVSGMLCMLMGVTAQAPDGGLFMLGSIGRAPFYLLATLSGALTGAIAAGILKKPQVSEYFNCEKA